MDDEKPIVLPWQTANPASSSAHTRNDKISCTLNAVFAWIVNHCQGELPTPPALEHTPNRRTAYHYLNILPPATFITPHTAELPAILSNCLPSPPEVPWLNCQQRQHCSTPLESPSSTVHHTPLALSLLSLVLFLPLSLAPSPSPSLSASAHAEERNRGHLSKGGWDSGFGV